MTHIGLSHRQLVHCEWDFWLLAKCDGKARPMLVIAGNNLQIAANLLDERENEFHPKPLAFDSLDSGR
jgi:hypothetical protein